MAGSRAAASASHGTMASASTSPSIEDKCCECAPLAADAGEDSEDDLDEVLNRIMVPAESSAPTFEDTLAASENLFEKTCEILGIPKTETQILAEDDTGMLIPRSSGPAMPRPYDGEDCRARHRCRRHPLAETTAQRLLGDPRQAMELWQAQAPHHLSKTIAETSWFLRTAEAKPATISFLRARSKAAVLDRATVGRRMIEFQWTDLRHPDWLNDVYLDLNTNLVRMVGSHVDGTQSDSDWRGCWSRTPGSSDLITVRIHHSGNLGKREIVHFDFPCGGRLMSTNYPVTMQFLSYIHLDADSEDEGSDGSPVPLALP